MTDVQIHNVKSIEVKRDYFKNPIECKPFHKLTLTIIDENDIINRVNLFSKSEISLDK